VTCNVGVEPQVRADLAALGSEDERLVEIAVRLMLELRDNPWLGHALWERYNLRPLEGCRSIRFDVPDRRGKPRYRLVYRNEPGDGAPALVRVWSVGPRESLVAYARAAARVSRERARRRRRG